MNKYSEIISFIIAMLLIFILGIKECSKSVSPIIKDLILLEESYGKR